MLGRGVGGGAEIAGNSGDCRKSAEGNAALLGEQGNEARVRLVRRKTADGAARDAAAQLNGGNNFFQAGDRRAGKSFGVEMHRETALLRIADPESGHVLGPTARAGINSAAA